MVFEMGFAIGALLLLGVLIYGVRSYSARNPANDAITEQATRELYADPDRYDAHGKKALKDRIRPS